MWAKPALPHAPKTFRPSWLQSRAELPRFDRHQPEHRGSARERGYTTQWDKARKGWFARNPLCVCCKANGAVNVAAVLDHIEPHKGDMVKFWKTGNWQGLCEWCDKNLKRSIENDWLKGKASAPELSLDRVVAGWVHPAQR